MLQEGARELRIHLQAAISMIEPWVRIYRETSLLPFAVNSPFSLGVPVNETPGLLKDAAAIPMICLIMWFDVLTSITVETRPRLHDLYIGVLESPSLELNLGDIIGCQNWVVTSLLSIYSLRDWKQCPQQAR
jgi:hypothetical protein